MIPDVEPTDKGKTLGRTPTPTREMFAATGNFFSAILPFFIGDLTGGVDFFESDRARGSNTVENDAKMQIMTHS